MFHRCETTSIVLLFRKRSKTKCSALLVLSQKGHVVDQSRGCCPHSKELNCLQRHIGLNYLSGSLPRSSVDAEPRIVYYFRISSEDNMLSSLLLPSLMGYAVDYSRRKVGKTFLDVVFTPRNFIHCLHKGRSAEFRPATWWCSTDTRNHQGLCALLP